MADYPIFGSMLFRNATPAVGYPQWRTYNWDMSSNYHQIIVVCRHSVTAPYDNQGNTYTLLASQGNTQVYYHSYPIPNSIGNVMITFDSVCNVWGSAWRDLDASPLVGFSSASGTYIVQETLQFHESSQVIEFLPYTPNVREVAQLCIIGLQSTCVRNPDNNRNYEPWPLGPYLPRKIFHLNVPVTGSGWERVKNGYPVKSPQVTSKPPPPEVPGGRNDVVSDWNAFGPYTVPFPGYSAFYPRNAVAQSTMQIDYQIFSAGRPGPYANNVWNASAEVWACNFDEKSPSRGCVDQVVAYDTIHLFLKGDGAVPPGGGGGDPPGGPNANGNHTWVDPWGFYHVPGRNGTGIAYRRYDHPTGPVAINAQVTSDATDRDPGVVRDNYGRLWLSFGRGSDSYLTYSHDDGLTWTTPSIVLTGCTHPVIAIHPDSHAIVIAGRKSSDGSLRGVVQYPGDLTPGAEMTFKDESGATITATDDTFDIVGEYGRSGRWMLIYTSGGALVRRQSWDECATWALVS